MKEDEEVAEVEAQEAEEELAPTLSFTSLGIKGLSASAKHIAWSSAMDLVIVVSQENTIALHRLNWHRIWSITETREVTALAWKSDGKSVVTGFDDGHYTIWDIENGTARFSTVKHGTSSHRSRSAITQLSWTIQSESSTSGNPFHRKTSKYADTGRSKLATLWPLQGVDAPSGGLFSSSTMEADQSVLDKQGAVGDSSTTRLERSEPTNLDVLVVGHSDGHVYLYALGSFQIGSIDVSSHLRASKPTLQFGSVGLVSTTMSADFSSLILVAQLRAKDDSIKFDEQGGEVGPDGSTVLLTIDTSQLAKRNCELLAVVWQCTLVQDLYYRIAALTEKMALLWSDAITPFVTKMKLFAEKLELEGQTVESALLMLLTQGVQSTMLETLLAVNLGTKNVEMMMKSIQSTCDTLEHLVSQHLRPTTERLMYRLILLNSYARHRRVFSDVGLSEQPISEMMQSAQGMISHSANFVLHLSRSKQLYTSFLTWIHQYTLDASDRDPVAISQQLMAQQSKLQTSIQQLVSQMLSGDVMKQDFIGELIRGRISAPLTASVPPLFNSATTSSLAGSRAATPGFLKASSSDSSMGNTSGIPIVRQASPVSASAHLSDTSTGTHSAVTLPLQQGHMQRSSSTISSTAPTSSQQYQPQKVVFLDESAGLGLDESLHYGDMSIEDQDMVGEGSLSMALDDSLGASIGAVLNHSTPHKASFQLPMTSSPEASNMGPIQLIELPPRLGFAPDHTVDLSSAEVLSQGPDRTTAPFKNPLESPGLSFSGLRISVHQQAEQVFESISNHLSTTFTASSALILFSRPELLSDELTEVFPMKDFTKIMQDEYGFQFYTEADTQYLLFKDAASLWVLRANNSESFGISGIEISTLYTEEVEAPSEEMFLNFQYYKDQQLMALIKPLEGPKTCQLQKLNLADLQYYPTKIEVANASNGMINYFDDIVMMHPFQHTSEECLVAQRDFPGFDALSMALSGPRGVGLLLGAPRKCMLLDLESDETPEEQPAEVTE